MDANQKLKKLIKQLKSIRGRHTELVTVYIPSGYSLSDVVSQLRTEQGTAENIKSKSVRKNVTTALDKIVRHLQLYRKTPEHGLAIFCGNISEKEGVDDIEIFAIEPPEPVRVKLYWCDQVFRLEPLEDIVREKEIYGIICLDKSEADIALLKGKKIESLVHMDSIVPGKTRAGGQSSVRFARIREGLKNDWLKRIGDLANKTFVENEEMRKNMLGILVSGPGPVKEEFIKGDYVLTALKDKVIGIIDTGYTGDFGLDETVERGKDILKEASVTKEKNLVKEFFTQLQKSGPVVYGVNETLKALRMGAVATLLINENIEYERVRYTCSCGGEKEEILRKGETIICEACNQQAKVTERKSLSEAVEEECEQYGCKLEFISEDTREGQQFKELGGIGGILRYQI